MAGEACRYATPERAFNSLQESAKDATIQPQTAGDANSDRTDKTARGIPLRRGHARWVPGVRRLLVKSPETGKQPPVHPSTRGGARPNAGGSTASRLRTSKERWP